MANAKINTTTPPAPAAHAVAQEVPTKTATIIMLLQREGGATLGDLVAATGWLPHTTRAALTGLRKKGHAISKTKPDGVTTYSIASAA
jgi:predicted ArsR family transcriptional regulator